MDWNETDPAIVATCSVDTTCTIWNVEVRPPVALAERGELAVTAVALAQLAGGTTTPQSQVAKTQLIAHDREVFDVAFAKGVDVFASVGADGSLRSFDLR